MRRSCHCWNGCVPPPTIAMLRRSAHFTSASRMTDSSSCTCTADWQTPVDTSIIDEVISGTTEPGSLNFDISRSISSEYGARS
jgi:hypothetical protein